MASVQNAYIHAHSSFNLKKKSFLTKFTFEWLHFRIYALVFNQLSTLRKYFLTKFTFVGLLI